MNTKILVVGLGGLGVPVCLYLNSSGAGTLGLLDNDVITVSNLSRQPIYSEASVGQKKASFMAHFLSSINSNLKCKVHDAYLSEKNADEIINLYDMVLDCSDNFQTKYLINQVCVKQSKPWISASIYQYEGQLIVFSKFSLICYNCIFPKFQGEMQNFNCSQVGIFTPLAGIMGAFQAAETIKIATNIKSSLTNKLVLFNSFNFETTILNLEKDPNCKVCNNNVKSSELFFESNATALNKESFFVNTNEVFNLIYKGKSVQLIDVRSAVDFRISHIPYSINMPYEQIIKNQFIEQVLNLVKLNKSLIFYCSENFLALECYLYFLDRGIKSRVFYDGFNDWIDQKLTFESSHL